MVRTETDAPYTWGTANSDQLDEAILGLSPGNYKLRAVAIDDKGASASAEIAVIVEELENQTRWTFLIFMNGDNTLEDYVVSDLNYLEEVGSGDGVHLVVQADRIEGFDDFDGDWTTTRRYYITQDADPNTVSSEMLEDLGELDMGAPETLTDFLLWARSKYPAERTVLILWDHGDSWWAQSDQTDSSPIPKSISDDSTNQSSMSIAQGELTQALADYMANNNPPIDVLGFDACLMASWEVAHSLRNYAHYLDASENYVYDVGILVAEAVQLVRNNPDISSAALVDSMASASVTEGEVTYSAVDIDALDKLSSALDDLARAVLDDHALVDPLLVARTAARGMDDSWKEYYLDVNDLGVELSKSNNAVLRSHGQAIQEGIDEAVLGAYGNSSYTWTGGLTIMFDTSTQAWLDNYSNGAGATWSLQTAWDDLLQYLASVNR